MSVDFSRDPTDPRDQLEMFVWKFPDVARADITALLDEFLKFDYHETGELEEDQAMMLLEHRGETKTALELRAMVRAMDKNNDHKLNFLEWACCRFQKSWEELHTFADEATRAAAMAQMAEARAAAEAVQQEMAEAKRRQDEAAAQRAAELEAEAKLTGVAGMSAFFKRRIEDQGDVTKTNEQKIKEEAARRKALREAERKAQEAQELANSAEKTREQVDRELAEAKAKADAEVAAREAAAKEEERQRRAAFKAAQQAKWEAANK